jgi:hypothetical protein
MDRCITVLTKELEKYQDFNDIPVEIVRHQFQFDQSKREERDELAELDRSTSYVENTRSQS